MPRLWRTVSSLGERRTPVKTCTRRRNRERTLRPTGPALRRRVHSENGSAYHELIVAHRRRGQLDLCPAAPAFPTHIELVESRVALHERKSVEAHGSGRRR